MLKLNFSGDGEIVGETTMWRHGTRYYRQPAKERRPRPEVPKGPKMCVYCMRVQVYGVSTCLRCLHRIGCEVAASILVYPHQEGYRTQVSNLRKVLEEMSKYGVAAPPQWADIVAGRKNPPKKKAVLPHMDARRLHGRTAVPLPGRTRGVSVKSGD